MKFKYKITAGDLLKLCHNGIDLDREVRYLLDLDAKPEDIKIEIVEPERP